MSKPNTTYTKAQFFKCALQVNPASYIKFRGQQHQMTEDAYNQQLLNVALEEGIKIVGLANHGCVKEIDKIRDLFSQHGIVVFPGFEIASSEKIHFVCLFDETSATDLLVRHLGALEVDVSQPEAPTRKSAIDIINYINQRGGFIFAAHSTHDNGILKLRMNTIWKHEELLAAQIPGPIEDLRAVEDDFYRKALLNKLPDYRRKRKIAIINAADVAHPEDLRKEGASCLIKMTKPCFLSFKQAFCDAESRVRLNSDKTENHASAIERVRFIGGYLDGLDIELSDHLNAVIGGRGTGKSTLLECIRFAFELEPLGKNAKNQHEMIIKSNLGSERGLIEIHLRSATMHGRKFVISRKYGNATKIIDDRGNISTYTPKDLMPSLEFYGQNEIYELTRDAQSRDRLITRFLSDQYKHFDSIINQILTRLKENRISIENAISQKAEIEVDVERMPKLLEQAKQFEALGIAEKLKIVPYLEKEKQLNDRIDDEMIRVKNAFLTFKNSIPDTLFLSDNNLEGLPHAELFKQQRESIEDFKVRLTQVINQLTQIQETGTQNVDNGRRQLEQQIELAEHQLDATFKLIPANQGKTGRQIGTEYQSLLKQIEQIRPKQMALQQRQEQINALKNHRQKILLELEQQTTARSSVLQRAVSDLNRKLKQKVRLKMIPENNRQVIVDFLNTCNLDGVGAKRLSWVLEGIFSPTSLATIIRQGEDALKNSTWNITPAVAQALHRLPDSRILELEELVLPDTMSIELNVTHGEQDAQYRRIEDLSTGQQCTAVLHLLLLENQDPLILDQPEDNLDNAFIAERIVEELRSAKLTRQFLFATHNANIPVFGDAEWIGVLSVQDQKGRILPEQQGAIDMPAVQILAADILEGGKIAFNQRREKYGFDQK